MPREYTSVTPLSLFLAAKQQPLSLSLAAKQQAVLRFWELLADFVATETAPATWRVAVPGNHPFLCSDPAQLRIVLAPRSG